MDNNEFGYFGKSQVIRTSDKKKTLASPTSKLENKKRLICEHRNNIEKKRKRDVQEKTARKKWTKDQMITLIFEMFEGNQNGFIFKKDLKQESNQSNQLISEGLREICWFQKGKWYLREDYKLKKV